MNRKLSTIRIHESSLQPEMYVPDEELISFTKKSVKKVHDLAVRIFGMPKFLHRTKITIEIFDTIQLCLGGIVAAWQFEKNGIPTKKYIPFLHLSIPRLRSDLLYVYCEYASIAKRKYIGAFDATWQEYILALICHEMAHVIQCYIRQYGYDSKYLENVNEKRIENFVAIREMIHKFPRPHGRAWQNIYRILRSELVGK
jgi:hypothetical protein